MTAAVRAARLALGLVLVAVSAVYAYVEMFSHFRFYDDEGFLMASVRSFVDGRTLYDERFTLYGPVYYLVAKFLYFIAGVPVTHDATRLATIGFWLATSALAAAFVYKLTSSLGWTVVAYLQTVLHGWSLCNEPGHPQTLLICLSMSLPFVAAVFAPAGAGSVLLGLLVACIALTKINLGIYAVTGLLIAYSGSTVSRRPIRLCFFALSAAAAVLPFVLMRNHLSGWTLNYASVCALSTAGCCITIAHADVSNRLRPSDLGVFLASGVVSAIGVISIILLTGTSLSALVTGILLAPLRFPSLFFTEWRLPPVAVAVGAMSVGAAVIAGRLDQSRRARLGILLKLGFGGAVIVTLFLERSDLASVATLMWVTLLPPGGEPWRGEAFFPRAVLCLSASLHLLAAYPVAGSQQDWATMLLIPAAVVSMADVSSVVASRIGSLRHVVEPVLLTVAVLTYYRSFEPERVLGRYHALSPLHLPGASRIRLEAQQARVYRELVQTIERDCDTFAAVPQFTSLHFWTGQEPLAGFDTGIWMTLIDEDTQRRLVSGLAERDSACVIYNPTAMKAWSSVRAFDGGPLMTYIQRSFRTVRTTGDYQLMIRKERAWIAPD